MKGSSNDAVSAGVPWALVVFALGKTMLDPPRVSSHRDDAPLHQRITMFA
jgi:hypothetical protein